LGDNTDGKNGPVVSLKTFITVDVMVVIASGHTELNIVESAVILIAIGVKNRFTVK